MNDRADFRLAPQVGFEPTTLRLTAECSTIELLRSVGSAPKARRRPYHSIAARAVKTLKVTAAENLRRNEALRFGGRWRQGLIV
jgi:hypothetical protein